MRQSRLFFVTAMVTSTAIVLASVVRGDTLWSTPDGLSFTVLLTQMLPRSLEEWTTSALTLVPRLLLGVVVAYVLAYLYEMLFAPYSKHMTLEEIERDSVLSGLSQCAGAKSRRPGDLPPPYPNGWFKILESRELPLGHSKSVQFLGQHMVAFRGYSGRVSVIDAYCPHLGANLAAGGKVVDDRIVCPFHGWEFNGDGRCERIPYSTAPIPEKARTHAWHADEANGQIYVWFDAEQREPYWRVFRSEIDTSGFHFHGNTSHQVKAHCQEMPENGADFAHLNFLHVPCAISRFLEDKIQHRWLGKWEPGKDHEPHRAYLDLHQHMEISGRKLPGTYVHVEVTQDGPGLVFLRFTTPAGRLVVIETVTPVKPMLQLATHVIYAEARVPRCVAKFVLSGLVVQFERDVPIWNNKTFLPTPLVVKGDGPIAAFRRWYAKFYSESSGKYRGCNGIDW